MNKKEINNLLKEGNYLKIYYLFGGYKFVGQKHSDLYNNITLYKISCELKNDLDIIKFLIDKGYSIFELINQPLIHAVQCENLKMFKFFVEYLNTDLNNNIYIDYIINYAVSNNKIDFLKYLLKNKVNVHLILSESLECAKKNSYNNILSLIRLYKNLNEYHF
jgi:hypothetical protein